MICVECHGQIDSETDKCLSCGKHVSETFLKYSLRNRILSGLCSIAFATIPVAMFWDGDDGVLCLNFYFYSGRCDPNTDILFTFADYPVLFWGIAIFFGLISLAMAISTIFYRQNVDMVNKRIRKKYKKE